MSLLDAFFAALTQAPGDWLARTALADWYEENGLAHSAECVRWVVRRQRRPSVNPAGRAFWFNADRPMPYTETVAHLPAPLFHALSAARGDIVVRWYPDLREAEEDLHAVWVAARDAGWVSSISPTPSRKARAARSVVP